MGSVYDRGSRAPPASIGRHKGGHYQEGGLGRNNMTGNRQRLPLCEFAVPGEIGDRDNLTATYVKPGQSRSESGCQFVPDRVDQCRQVVERRCTLHFGGAVSGDDHGLPGTMSRPSGTRTIAWSMLTRPITSARCP